MKCLHLIVILTLASCASTPESHNPVSHRPVKPPVSEQPAHSASRHQQIARIVRRMRGRPYQYGGTTPSGFDCSGLVWYSHYQVGIRVPRTAAQQYRAGRKISHRKIRPGDLLFYRISRTNPYHVATYTGNGQFVHAPSSGKKVMAVDMQNPYWKKRLIGIRRLD